MGSRYDRGRAGYQRAREDAAKAVALAPDHADGYSARAFMKESLDWDWAGAQAAQIAEVYAWRNEKDKAFEWLDRAFNNHDGGLNLIKIDLFYKNLRADPRYPAFLRKMNLPT